MDELMSIGEFAHACGLSISALRFYADRGLLPPADIDPRTGYRRYRQEQLADAEFIRDLRRLDVTLAAIADLLTRPMADRVGLIDEQVERLDARLRTARTSRERDSGTKDATTAATLGGADLAAALGQVLFVLGTDLWRPLLTCLLIEARQGSLRLVATDSFRLAVRDIPLRTGAARFRALLPGPAATSLAHGHRDTTDISLDLNGGNLEVISNRGTTSFELVPVEFVAYEDLLEPEPGSHSSLISRTLLEEALEAAGARNDVVVLTFEPGSLNVEGKAEVAVAASYEGPRLEVAVNSRYAGEAVAATTGSEVVIEAVSPLKRIAFRSADDGSYVHLLMPIRRHEP